MSDFDAHREIVQNELDRLVEKQGRMETDPHATLAEWRVVQREIEQLQHRLIFFDSPLSKLHFRD